MALAGGLSINVVINSSKYLPSALPFEGVFLRIHGNYDYPLMHLRNWIILPTQRLKIAMEPTMIVADPEIISLPLKRRGCCFNFEVFVYYVV